MTVASVMVVVYPIGVPLLFWRVLRPYRQELTDIPTRQSDSAKSRHLSFFWMDYKGCYWYWEIIELLRKMVLNGLLILCEQGSILQLAVALLIITIHLLLIIRVQPFLVYDNNALNAWSNFLLFISFLAVMLLQVLFGTARNGFDTTLILGILVAAAALVLILGVVCLMNDISPNSRLMHDAKGQLIEFKRLRADGFHLFLR